MRKVVFKRVLQGIPVVFGVSFITFSLMNLLPGDTALAILGPQATPISLAALRKQLGLNEPFIPRYFGWLGGLLEGHLGRSLVSSQPVATILAQRVPVTLEIIVFAMFFALAAALPVALLAAHRPNSVVDRFSVLTSMVGLSVPGFVVGLVLILIFAVHLHLFPATGFVPLSKGLFPNIRTVILPSVTLGFVIFCSYSRVLRADLIEQMASEDYIVVARGKGLTRWKALRRHAFRNALFPLLTLVGLNLGQLLGGTVIIESIFAVPGIGQLLYTSIQDKDAPVVEAIVVLVAVVVVIANLATDLLYSVLDPRVRYGSSSR